MHSETITKRCNRAVAEVPAELIVPQSFGACLMECLNCRAFKDTAIETLRLIMCNSCNLNNP